MSIADDIKSMFIHTKRSYDVMGELGATLPENKNLENLVSTIESLPVKKYPQDAVVVLSHIGGSGNAIFRNRWNSTVLINGQAVASNETLTLNFDVNDNATVIFSKDDRYPTAFRDWGGSGSAVVTAPNSNCRFEITYISIDDMLTDDNALGDYVLYCFANDVAISKIAHNAMDFSKVTKVGTNFCSSFCAYNSSITSIPKSLFYFPNLENVVGVNFMNAAFRNCTNIETIEENNFNFPKLTIVNGAQSFQNAFISCSRLSKIEKGCFQFPVLQQLLGNYHFAYCLAACPLLTELPINSFNWGNNLNTVGSKSFLNYFSQDSGITVPGNGMVQIYTPVAVTNFDGDKDYSARSTIYVNGSTITTDITTFKAAVDDGTASQRYLANSIITDTYNGDTFNWVVGHYGTATMSDGSTQEGVYLFADQIVTRQAFGSNAYYNQSTINTWLNNTFFTACSDNMQNMVSEISVTGSDADHAINAKFWLMSAGEMLGATPSDTNGGGVAWDAWKARTGLSSPSMSSNNGRIMKENNGSAYDWLTRSVYNVPYVYGVSTIGACFDLTPSYVRGVVPACFVSRS